MKKLLTTLLSAVVTMVIATATLASAQTSSLRGSDTFTDVPAGHWADEAIGWAVENGITTGTSDTTFSPNDTLTRAHMVTFLYRYHKNVVSAETQPTPPTTETQAPTATAPVTLTGQGQDVTSAATLTEGRWRVTITVKGNIDDAFGLETEDNFIVYAIGSSDASDLLVNDIAGAGTWTSSLTIGDGFLAIAAGKVFFEVQAADSAMWTIRVEPI